MGIASTPCHARIEAVAATKSIVLRNLDKDEQKSPSPFYSESAA